MGTRIVDDRDPSISYTSAWGIAGGSNEYNFTTSWTTSQGLSATFRFSGSNVAVYGTITNEGLGGAPISTYSVDGGAEVRYTGIQKSNIQYKTLFFKSGTLPSGDHTLVVACASGNAFLYLDYFEVTLPSIISSSSTSVSSSTTTSLRSSTTTSSLSSSAPSSASSSTSSALSGVSSRTTSRSESPQPHVTEVISSTVTVTSDGSKSSNVEAAPSTSKSVSTGDIVGSVVGAIVALAFLVLLFFFLCRRRRRRQAIHLALPNSPGANPSPPTDQVVTPFHVATPSTPFFPPYTEGRTYSNVIVPNTQSTLSLLPKKQGDSSADGTYAHGYPPNTHVYSSADIAPLRYSGLTGQIDPTSATVSEKRDWGGHSDTSNSSAPQSSIVQFNSEHRSSGYTQAYGPPPSYNDVR